jgi:hypothetical protein
MRSCIVFHRRSAAQFSATLVLVIGGVVLANGPSPASFSAGSRRHAPAIIRERHGKNATSSNWGGYAVTDPNGTVTNVKGSWVVPAVTCTGGTDSYSSFWIGIDGYDSSTVEQIGVDADCVGGTAQYSAWFEFYPHWPYTINTVQVQAGDTISAEVSYGTKGQFTVTLTNLTRNQTFSTSTKMPQAKMSSAEWIVEAPWSSSILPLANFGVAEFGQRYTRVSDTCFATIGGTTGSIGSFDANFVKIDMVSSSGGLKAQASPLSKDGSSFTDAFLTAGP